MYVCTYVGAARYHPGASYRREDHCRRVLYPPGYILCHAEEAHLQYLYVCFMQTVFFIYTLCYSMLG